MADQEGSSLFGLCTFAFVPSSDLTETVIDELSQSIVKYGGQVCQRKRDGSLPLATITHIVSNTIEFPQYDTATAMMIPVVKSKWVSASLAKGKQAQIRPYTPDPRMIFSDVMLSCADIPENDKDTIIGATMAMGGMYSDHVTKLTTHICALSTDHPKVRMAMEKKHKCNIVLPHWFDDCFKLGKRIDEGPYLLPNPEILRMSPGRSIEPQCSPYLDGAISTRPEYMHPPTNEDRQLRLTVFKEKKIMLSKDLEMRGRLRDILVGLVTSCGGQITDDAHDCDWLVCRYRDTDEYIQASQLGKTVGNMAWLFYLIQHDAWSNPLHRLLHYPEPRNGIPGFKDMRISVSNYGGEARIYLENLIKCAGATFTKTMKADNTHLVTARDNSEKCEAARDWNIHMVNHLWIEESYAKCEMQTLTVFKYTHFPPRTNLGEIIGQTFFDEKKLKALYFPGGPEKSTVPPARKRKALEMTDENSFAEDSGSNAAAGRQTRKEFDIMRDRAEETTDVTELPAPSKRRPTEFATPARGRHVRSGKENETPSTITSSSRSAKDKALGKLSNLAPDIALYEKEKKRGLKDGSLWGGKRAADLIERENLNRRRMSSPTAGDDKAEKRPAKKARPTLPEVEVRVILTGFKRWVNDKHKEDADRKKLRDMGIAVVQDGQPCDYLVAPQLVRTVKFLRNLSKGAMILSSTWIEQCLDTKQVPDPEEYILKDIENEKRFGLKLETSIQRAQKNKGRLLAGIPIYCAAGIKNGTESYQAIAQANGAIFMVYGPKSGSTIRPTKPEEDEGGPEPVYLLSTATPDEKKLWKRFEDMARRGNMEPRVVASDWLLDVVMKQEDGFDEKYLVKNFFT